MTTHQDLLSGLDKIADEGLNELLRRVQDINNSYRAVAEKMGQLYMCADELQLTALTRDLDKPMRNASDNEQLFAALLEDLHAFTRRTS
jgi:predicted transcriptional regulator